MVTFGPTGAPVELHEAVPPLRVLVHNVVVPVVKVTNPVGTRMPGPAEDPVTVAEYEAEVP
jgi:hypothetical protein